MRPIFVVLIAILVFGCVHQVKLIDPQTGRTVYGSYNSGNKTATVTLPSGETFTGTYSAVSNATVSFGSLFSGSKMATGYAVSSGGTGKVYAILSGDRGGVMEVLAEFSDWDNSGFGEARTKDGQVYKVMF